MGDHPRLASAVTFCLLSGLDEIKILHELHLLVEVLKFLTDHIWRVRPSGELLTSPCGKASSPEFVAPETLAPTPLGS
jgi:hypothetical protein